MPSQPDETPAMDLRHIVQYAQLASMLVCHARNHVVPTKRRVSFTIQEENELLDYLRGIEERAKAATAKLTPAAVPNEYLTGVTDAGLPSKLLRYYDCVMCSKPHWEDERPLYDEHVGYRAAAGASDGFKFGHRRALELLRGPSDEGTGAANPDAIIVPHP